MSSPLSLSHSLPLPIGLILCGGKSTRMEGTNKALVDFGGQPLLQRIRSRLEPQVSRLLLNVAEKSEEYDEFQLEYCLDLKPDAGPLMGLASAFKVTEKENILLCPCDAPFVPENLAERLMELMMSRDADIVCPTYGRALQPTFALWHRRCANRVISAATNGGLSALKELYPEFRVATLEWPEESPEPFFNINKPSELDFAEGFLEKQK